MLIWENIKFAFRAIWSFRVRSFLTMLGVIIGVFSVITLIAIGEGVKGEFANQVESIGSNLIFVLPGKIDTQSTSFNPSQSFGLSTLKLKDVEAIKKEVTELVGAVPLILLSGPVKVQNQESFSTIVMGTGSDHLKVINTRIEKGEFFTEADDETQKKVAVIGFKTAKNLFSDQDPINQIITFQNQDFKIIGVLEPFDNPLEQIRQGGVSLDDVMLIPTKVAQELADTDTVFRIATKAKNQELVNKAVERIKEVIKQNHNGEEDFSVFTQEDILDLFNQFFDILNKTVAGIGAISLIVGGIGIMNIMYVSVSERTKEIGIRKAIGASSGNILLQFLIESATISFLGGALGFILSLIVTTHLITPQFNIPTTITVYAVVLALAISIGVGVIFGVAPAIRAARLNPIEALRHE